MRFPPCCLLALAWCLTTGWAVRALADPPMTALTPEAVADFEWFSTLGFPDVKGCPAVLVTFPGAIITSVGPPQDVVWVGFLLRHGGDGQRTVLTPDLIVHGFGAPSPGPSEQELIRYEEKPLAIQADAKLDFLRRAAADPTEFLRRRFEERLSERAQVFVWAWACWRNGLETHAARLYAYIAAMPSSEFLRHEPEKPGVRARLENDLGAAMLGRATLDFGDPRIPRTQLRDRFERIARDYPASTDAAPRRRDGKAPARDDRGG